jgi:hypothetical protein
MRRNRWLALAACVVLAGCASESKSKSEDVARGRQLLALPPQISPDFAVDHEVPDFDPNATLLSAVGSVAQGFLLSYNVRHQAEAWSRVSLGVTWEQDPPATELVFVRLAPTGATDTLARLPIDRIAGLRAIDLGIGNGWLVVYETRNATGDAVTRYVASLSAAGTFGTPKVLPSSCNAGLVGFARGGSTALLTDLCGAGLLLDLTGNVQTSLTIATPSSFATPAVPGKLVGGQVAFNGIDYLAVYGFVTSAPEPQKPTFGFPITPPGTQGTPILIANPQAPDGPFGVEPVSVAANGNAFLTVLSQGRADTFPRDYSYRIATEATDHVFTPAAERYFPQSDYDSNAQAIALNGQFTIVYVSNGLKLLQPGADPALPDSIQALVANFPFSDGGSRLMVEDGQGGSAKHLLLASQAGQAQRFDQSFQAIDAKAALTIPRPREQHFPSFAFDGQRFLAAWGEHNQIRAQHLSANGAVLDDESLILSNLPSELHAPRIFREPRLVANSKGFAALFDTGQWVTLSNTEPPVHTSFDETNWLRRDTRGIATDGERYLVAATSDGELDVVLPDMGAGGKPSYALLRRAIPANPTPTGAAIAFNANQYVVLWTGAGNSDERVVYGIRVTPNPTNTPPSFGGSGSISIDQEPKELLRFRSPTIPGNSSPADTGVEVIRVDDHFLVAWQSVTNDVQELRVARLSATLDLLDPGGVLLATQPFPPLALSRWRAAPSQSSVLTGRRMALGWDGSSGWVVWADGEGGSRAPFGSLRGRRFSGTLEPLDEAPFLIASDLDEFSKITLAVGSEGRSLVGYTRYRSSDSAYRVYARFLSSAPFVGGSPCSAAEQCASGSCVASVCGPGNGGVAGSAGEGGDAGASSGGEPDGTAGTDSSRGGTAGTDSSRGGRNGSTDVGGASGHAQGGTNHAGTNARGGDRSDHGCSIAIVNRDASRESVWPLAVMLAALGGLRRRRAS